MGILDRLDAIAGTAAPEAPVATEGSFSRGLRQGVTAAGGQLRALAGGVAEAVGATDFAQAQYARAHEAEVLAAAQAPAVTDWRDVANAPDLSTGLRRAGQYGAGLAGQSVPLVGLGLGAGALAAMTHSGSAIAPLAAGTAAVAPFEMGGALERQQQDPAALANNTPVQRLGTAALEGTGRALAMNAVPQLMGGKLLGSSLGAASKAGILAEGVGGNALAGAAAEKISTTAEDSLNPNRDTGGDNTRMIDAAVGGGVLGLPFAGAGLAGHALHGKGEAPAAKSADATPVKAEAPSLTDRIKGAFTKSDDTAEKIAAGKDVIDVEALKGAAPEMQGRMVEEADAKRAETVKGWFQELTQDGKLSDENKAALHEAATDFTDRGKQAVIAGVKLASDAGGKAATMAKEFYDVVFPQKPRHQGNAGKDLMLEDGKTIEGETRWRNGPQQSEAASGADRVIAEAVTPHLERKYPQLVANETAMKSVTAGLRRVMQDMQDTGRVDRGVAQHLRNWFGKDTADVMSNLHDAVLGDLHKGVMDGGNKKAENYYTALNDLADGLGRQDKLAGQIRSALSPEAQKTVTPDQLDQMAKHMQEYVSGATMAGKPQARRLFESRQIEAAMREHFGDKTDELLASVKDDMDHQREKEVSKLDDQMVGEHPDKLDADSIEYAGNHDDGFADHKEAGITTEQDLAREYYGGGKDKLAPQFVPSEQAHRALYGNEDSQAAKIFKRVSSENPDKNVSYVTAAEYAREHGISTEGLGLKGDPKDYVMVKAEGQKSEGLSWRDVDSARLDTHKYPDSKSRIDTESGDHIFDAVKIMKMYAQEHKLPRDEMDAQNPFYRLRRQFAEAIGALSDHIGESVDVDPTTVVARRGGRDITWGELQKLGAAKPDEKAKMVSSLHAEREAAVKVGDTETVADLDRQLDAHTKFDEPVPIDASSVRKALARSLGEARQQVEAELAKNGPRGATPADLRRQALGVEDMVERMKKDSARGAQKDMFDPLEQQHWAERAENLRSLADSLEGAGGARPYTMTERKAIREYMKREKDYERFEADQAERVRREAKTNLDDVQGAAEPDPFGNVHEAADGLGDKLGGAFAGARNMEAGPEGNLLHASNFAPDTHFDGRLSRDIVSAVAGRVQQFELGKSAPARAIGEKGRHLLGVLDQMRRMDQADLASVVKEKSGSERAKTINELYAKYKDMVPAAPEKGSFVDRVVGRGDVSEVVKAVKASSDTRGLQRAVDALIPHQHDASARAVLEVANERLGKLVEKDPEIAYSMQQVNPAARSTSKIQGDVRAYVDKVLGKTVDTEFTRLLHAGEFATEPGRVAQGLNQDVIRVSVHALDPMSVGYHEALHAFWAKLHDAGLADAAHPLMQAANSERVLKQLRTLLANEPDALAQLSSQHERAAYMYQFWAAGKLKLQPRPEGLMGHVADFFKRMMGVWTNDARAQHIMEYFHSGEYGQNLHDRSAVAHVLAEGTNAHWDKFKGMVAPLSKLATAVAATGDGRLRGTGVAALVELADKVYSPLHGEHGDGDPGYMPAARAQRGIFMNRLAESLRDHDAGTITDALMALQRGEKGTTPKERSAVATVRRVLDDAFTYMQKAGVQVNDLGYGKDYFPRVWDPQAILKNEAAFRDMLEGYRRQGLFKGSTDAVIATLSRTDGADLQVQTVKPGMQFTKERVLHFISGRDAEPFLNKNLYQTLSSYITQATRRAEWARRFNDDGSGLHDLLHRAEQEGATREHLQLASDYLQGVDGTLGDHIDPRLRRAFGNMIVYQNVRLLPLALFSSLIDPLGIVVRGGSVKDGFAAMKRGFAEMPKGFRKEAKADHWTEMAHQLGVIDNAVLMHTVGTSFSQGMTSDFGRKVNDTFFKYNLMEQFNSSMRVAATQAASGFLAKHADGTASPHSARWLAELGFKPGEIRVQNGEPLLTAAQFEASGMKPKDAAAAADRMTLAVNKWVDGAILRPNAAHKPVWMNDPHFAVVAHLKQFVYSFQETILKRVANEVRFGNVGPAYALASYVPFMLAADTMKGLILGGGEQPDWKKGWDAGDYAFYEVQRAGLFGVGQFGVDAAKDLYRGGVGVGALAGPTIEQLGEAVKTVAGPEQFKTFALNSMPANALFDAAGNATASTNAID